MKKLNTYETYIISCLAQGANIGEVRKVLRYYGQKPNSESSVDKKLKELRKRFQCNTTIQLVYKLKNYVIPIAVVDIFK
tara:strand:+ start:262 stop:498 length:237 start_codon:yes stop_codon:yes gene_type:complete